MDPSIHSPAASLVSQADPTPDPMPAKRADRPGVATREIATQEIAARLAVLLAGRYHVLRLIGIGGMASVYLVRHRTHRGLYAVKVMHPALAEQPDLLARFRREGLLSVRLAGHPNIAPVLDIGEGDGLHYLLMPYIRGEDLDHVLARTGPFSLNDALLVVAQINDVLLHAWNHGILHCDVTPANIRLNQFGHFLLLDFGLADSGLTSLSPDPPVLPASAIPRPGTPLYSSPERILGQQVDIRSDLYALGAILYELLTGEAFFHAESLEQIERKHLRPARDLSHPKLEPYQRIHPLLRSLLAFDPNDRPAGPLKLQETLRTLTNYPPPLTVQPAYEAEVQPPATRRRLSFR